MIEVFCNVTRRARPVSASKPPAEIGPNLTPARHVPLALIGGDSVQRRTRFPFRPGWLLPLLALGLVSVFFLGPQAAPPSDAGLHDTLVLMIAGGRTPSDNYTAFYISLVRLYETFTHDLGIPAENITVLYFDGQAPDPAELLNAEFGDPEAAPETPNPMWFYRQHLRDQAAAKTREALAALPAPPPIQGDTTRASILASLQRLMQQAPPGSGVWMVRSGHGGARSDERGVRSTMETLGGDSIGADELGAALRQETQAERLVLWLNQCMAFEFLELPKANPRLAVLTSCGARGADLGVVMPAVAPEWTWTQALREGLSRASPTCDSFARADANRDRGLSLVEIQGYVLGHDAAAVQGIRPHWDADPEPTHPGLAYGDRIDPEQPFAWDLACLPAEW